MKKIFLGLFAFVLVGWGIWIFATPVRRTGNPTVTVLMSTYNRAATMGPSIESILNQTYDDFEFIIVNDGSTDNTAEVLKSYEKRDPRVVVLTNLRNKGLVYSLNKGLDAARGKYIVRMDDDDFSAPHRLERQVLAMDTYPDITVLGGGIYRKDIPVSEAKPAEGKPEISDPHVVRIRGYFSAGVAHPTVIIRKDFLNTHKLRYREHYLYAEDCGLWKDILNAGGKISDMKESIMYYGVFKIMATPRADNYGYVQHQSFHKVQRERFAPFFPLTDKDLDDIDTPLGKCKIMKKMKEVNAKKNIVNQEVLEKHYKDSCVDDLDNAFEMKHPYWEDLVIIKGNRLERSGGDEATITKQNGETITVKWDKWDAEIYKKSGNEYKYIRDLNGNIKTKDK